MALALISFGTVKAQGGSPFYTDGMTIKLDTSGKKYIRFLTWATVWLRYTKANPGTAVNGVLKTSWSDIGLRQFRLVIYTQLSPRYLILGDIGVDNQGFSTGDKKPPLYIHDLWNEYTVVGDVNEHTGAHRPVSLYLGTGLHYWIGISRMTDCSSANYLAMDVPLYNWPLVDESDQFARQLGVYAKGNAGPVSYRWSVNKPFTVITPATAFPAGRPDSSFAVDNNQTGNLSTTGYAAWQFFEHENNLLPYTTGTYVGTAKVLNLGAGYYYAGEATTTQATNSAGSALIHHAISIWSVDVFADLPFGPDKKNWAFTGYSVYYHDDFGPGYLRFQSTMNAAVSEATGYTGKTSQAGFGNLAPVTGTGNSWYSQAGLLLPRDWIREIRLQPFGEFSRQVFDRYGNSVFTWWSAGANLYLDGHHARLTFKYQTRPMVMSDRQAGSKGSFILATQVYL